MLVCMQLLSFKGRVYEQESDRVFIGKGLFCALKGVD
jgi:hypothetical protein